MVHEVKINGTTTRIGDEHNLYNVRIDHALMFKSPHVTQDEGGLNPEAYAKPQTGFYYRFPFPEEDHIAVGQYDAIDKSVQFVIPKTLLNTGWTTFPWEGVDNPNRSKPYLFLEIVQQRLHKNVSRLLVLRDPHNRKTYTCFDLDQVINLVVAIRATCDQQTRPTYWREICRRILIGYHITPGILTEAHTRQWVSQRNTHRGADRLRIQMWMDLMGA